jgi:hypothetical protein
MNQPFHKPPIDPMNIFTRQVTSHPQHWFTVVFLSAWLGNVIAPNTRAQLAITEVMSDAATNCSGVVVNHPDFWELTNLGVYPVSLAGYRFWDKDSVEFDLANPLPDISIAPGESIIFVRQNSSVPDAAAFINWWGAANLPVNLRVYFYRDPGFDGEGGDGVRLWDANTNLVDEVYFDQAVLDQGITFVADPNTGQFGALSQLGVCGAFKAASCDDIGSPGFAPCDPVLARITQEPASQTVDAGSPATLHVGATGRPIPRGHQWFFNGTAVPSFEPGPGGIPVAVSYAGCGVAWKTQPDPGDLFIPNVQPSHAGQYFVVVTNGLVRLTSTVATLTVNTNPIAPQVECASSIRWCPPLSGDYQTNFVVSPGQTAIFDVRVRAYPAPTFLWSWSADGTAFSDLPAATNRTLTLTYVQPSDAGTYRVRVQNKHGTNFACATLAVSPKPALRITEAMPYTCPGARHDWWELTNIGDEPVTVTCHRWNDFPGNIGGGPTITNAILIQPGESVILMESQTRQSFLDWWGETNLPPNLQCIAYSANGLTETGDEITLWNQSATDKADFIDTVVFGTATQGSSFWFDYDFCPASEPGLLSVERECGAFRAAQGCDIGSPGWTRWTQPCLTAVRLAGADVMLGWRAQPGSRNMLQFAREMATPPSATVWTDVGAYTFTGATGTATHTGFQSDPHRFYRIVRVSVADCPCPQ